MNNIYNDKTTSLLINKIHRFHKWGRANSI